MEHSKSELALLLDIISTQGKRILDTCKEKNVAYPSLHQNVSDQQTEEFLNAPTILEASSLLIAAAGQLISTVRPPATSLLLGASSWAHHSSIRIFNESNIAEILREAGPKGLHVDEIAKATKIDPWKLGRIMRFLATHHYLREIEPNVFTNNRISILLDTGKSSKELFEKPEDKHDNTQGFSALIGLNSEECCKGSMAMLENLRDPKASHSRDPKYCNISYADNLEIPVWEWFSLPQNRFKQRRFGVAMSGANIMQPGEWAIKGFHWESLPKGSVVIDVGGGVGGVALQLCNAFPNLNLVVQERQAVVEQGTKWFESRNPEAIRSGRMKFETHDFFQPQPTRTQTPSAFILRMISHNWNDEWFRTIIGHLRQVSDSNTRLIIIDNVLQCAAPDPMIVASDIEGGLIPTPPEPLLSNMGIANSLSFTYDIAMLNNCNASERTIRDFVNVCTEAKWKVEKVYRPDPLSAWWSHVIAKPV